MASTPFSFSSETAAMEQVIAELFSKSVRIILESRFPHHSARNRIVDPFISSPLTSSSSHFRARDTCFNLTPNDCPAALDNFNLCRQSTLDQLVLDEILISKNAVRNAACTSPGGIFVRNLSSGRDEFGGSYRNGKIVERWIVQCDCQSTSQPERESSSQECNKGNSAAFQSSDFQVIYKKAYRRVIVLLRSLYSAVRLLPAYKLVRYINTSRQVHSFCLSPSFSSFSEPFSREEDAKMNQLEFGPLDICSRKFTLSVAYLKTLGDLSSSHPSTPLPSEFIMDYVGSPLADPLKRIPSLPIVGSSPSYAAFSQHIWCNDHGETSSPIPTPSHIYFDSRALNHNLNHSLHPRHHLPENFMSSCPFTHVSSSAHAKKNGDWWPSPPFSPLSSFPSTPTHLYGDISRSESAPINSLLFKCKGSNVGQNQCLSASSCSMNKRQGCPQVDTLKTQLNTTPVQKFLLKKKLQLKKEPLRFSEFQSDTVSSKTASAGKDFVGPITGLKVPSYTLPNIRFRSSSRFSFMDEFDDSDFICHFAEDDQAKNMYRVKSNNSKDYAGNNLCPGELMTIRRSPDAAVGALVRMLRSAPPLRFDKSNTLRSKQVFKDKGSSHKTQLEKMAGKKNDNLSKTDDTQCLDIATSEHFKLRTAADAFKELRTYKYIRELMLNQSRSQR